MRKRIQHQYADRELYYRIRTAYVSAPNHELSAREAAMELTARGLSVSDSDLNNLVRTEKEVIPKSDSPSRHARWTPELIEKAAQHFYETNPRTRLTSLARFLNDRGVTMDAYLLALEKAHQNVVFKKFGVKGKGAEAVKVLRYEPNPEDYEMHLLPERNGSKATIEFTLHPEALQEIEKITLD